MNTITLKPPFIFLDDFDSKLFKSNSLNAIQYCPTSNAINVPLTDEEIR